MTPRTEEKMQTKCEFNGFRASSDQARILKRPSLALSLVALMCLPMAARAQSTNCDPIYDPDTLYPALSRTGDVTIDGQAGVFIYLLDGRALVEGDDACLYEVDQTVLEIDVGRLREVELTFEMPEYPAGASIFVTRDGVWVETLKPTSGSFTYVLPSGSEFGFEIATPGMRAPTVPVLVVKPTTRHPEPM
jgi:hypothetical protein